MTDQLKTSVHASNEQEAAALAACLANLGIKGVTTGTLPTTDTWVHVLVPKVEVAKAQKLVAAFMAGVRHALR